MNNRRIQRLFVRDELRRGAPSLSPQSSANALTKRNLLVAWHFLDNGGGGPSSLSRELRSYARKVSEQILSSRSSSSSPHSTVGSKATTTTTTTTTKRLAKRRGAMPKREQDEEDLATIAYNVLVRMQDTREERLSLILRALRSTGYMNPAMTMNALAHALASTDWPANPALVANDGGPTATPLFSPSYRYAEPFRASPLANLQLELASELLTRRKDFIAAMQSRHGGGWSSLSAALEAGSLALFNGVFAKRKAPTVLQTEYIAGLLPHILEVTTPGGGAGNHAVRFSRASLMDALTYGSEIPQQQLPLSSQPRRANNPNQTTSAKPSTGRQPRKGGKLASPSPSSSFRSRHTLLPLGSRMRTAHQAVCEAHDVSVAELGMLAFNFRNVVAPLARSHHRHPSLDHASNEASLGSPFPAIFHALTKNISWALRGIPSSSATTSPASAWEGHTTTAVVSLRTLSRMCVLLETNWYCSALSSGPDAEALEKRSNWTEELLSLYRFLIPLATQPPGSHPSRALVKQEATYALAEIVAATLNRGNEFAVASALKPEAERVVRLAAEILAGSESDGVSSWGSTPVRLFTASSLLDLVLPPPSHSPHLASKPSSLFFSFTEMKQGAELLRTLETRVISLMKNDYSTKVGRTAVRGLRKLTSAEVYAGPPGMLGQNAARLNAPRVSLNSWTRSDKTAHDDPMQQTAAALASLDIIANLAQNPANGPSLQPLHTAITSGLLTGMILVRFMSFRTLARDFLPALQGVKFAEGETQQSSWPTDIPFLNARANDAVSLVDLISGSPSDRIEQLATQRPPSSTTPEAGGETTSSPSKTATALTHFEPVSPFAELHDGAADPSSAFDPIGILAGKTITLPRGIVFSGDAEERGDENGLSISTTLMEAESSTLDEFVEDEEHAVKRFLPMSCLRAALPAHAVAAQNAAHAAFARNLRLAAGLGFGDQDHSDGVLRETNVVLQLTKAVIMRLKGLLLMGRETTLGEDAIKSAVVVQLKDVMMTLIPLFRIPESSNLYVATFPHHCFHEEIDVEALGAMVKAHVGVDPSLLVTYADFIDAGWDFKKTLGRNMVAVSQSVRPGETYGDGLSAGEIRHKAATYVSKIDMFALQGTFHLMEHLTERELPEALRPSLLATTCSAIKKAALTPIPQSALSNSPRPYMVCVMGLLHPLASHESRIQACRAAQNMAMDNHRPAPTKHLIQMKLPMKIAEMVAEILKGPGGPEAIAEAGAGMEALAAMAVDSKGEVNTALLTTREVVEALIKLFEAMEDSRVAKADAVISECRMLLEECIAQASGGSSPARSSTLERDSKAVANAGRAKDKDKQEETVTEHDAHNLKSRRRRA